MSGSEQAKSALVFVYNADSGLFNAVADTARKIFAPETYQCQLCALTYANLGMRQSWREFLQTLARPLEFLHRDELRARYGIADAPLPCVYERAGDRLTLLLDAPTINACRTLDELKRLIEEKIS